MPVCAWTYWVMRSETLPASTALPVSLLCGFWFLQRKILHVADPLVLFPFYSFPGAITCKSFLKTKNACLTEKREDAVHRQVLKGRMSPMFSLDDQKLASGSWRVEPPCTVGSFNPYPSWEAFVVILLYWFLLDFKSPFPLVHFQVILALQCLSDVWFLSKTLSTLCFCFGPMNPSISQ